MNDYKFQPTGNRILVKPDDPEHQTHGGLYIPDQVKQRPFKGTIVEVSSSIEGSTLLPGVRIYYGKYSATEIELEGKHGMEDMLLIREEEIYGIIQF